MGDRKQPRPVPTDQVRPDPPPPPPRKRSSFSMAIGELTRVIKGDIDTTSYGRCYIYSTEPTTCPLCKAAVPANTKHECSQPAPRKKGR